jgi:L-serine dehydratase
MEKRQLKYKSAFDIIGPIMIGPSSSHTAGVVKIGKLARILFQNEDPEILQITFYGSFAATYQGHGTALAIVAGVLGYETNDERIPQAIRLAKATGMNIEFAISDEITEHANTIRLVLIKGERRVNLVGISIGGGSIQLVELNTINVKHDDSVNGLILGLELEAATVRDEVMRHLDNVRIAEIPNVAGKTVYYMQTTSDVSTSFMQQIRARPGVNLIFATVG